MRFKHVIYSLLFFFSACSTTKTNKSISLADGYSYYKQNSPSLTIQLLGDYKFQPLKTKYFRDIEKAFIKYSTLNLSATTPKVLYTAHTIVQPYYSTICLQYNNVLLDSSLLNFIKGQLKEKVNASFKKYTEIKLESKNIYKLAYQVVNPVNEIATSNTEYFFKKGDYLYRLLFWTTENNDKVISEEAEYIIAHIQFD